MAKALLRNARHVLSVGGKTTGKLTVQPWISPIFSGNLVGYYTIPIFGWLEFWLRKSDWHHQLHNCKIPYTIMLVFGWYNGITIYVYTYIYLSMSLYFYIFLCVSIYFMICIYVFLHFEHKNHPCHPLFSQALCRAQPFAHQLGWQPWGDEANVGKTMPCLPCIYCCMYSWVDLWCINQHNYNWLYNHMI